MEEGEPTTSKTQSYDSSIEDNLSFSEADSSDDGSLNCYFRGQTDFYTQNKLKAHMVKDHSFAYNCDECSNDYPSQRKLTNHQLNVHQKEKTVQCNLFERTTKCSYLTNSDSRL